MIKPVTYQLPTLEIETDSIVNPLIASITASAYGVDPIAAAIISATANVQATSPVVPTTGNIISLNPIETAPVVNTPIKTDVSNTLLQNLVNVNPRPISSVIASTKQITVSTVVYDKTSVLPSTNVAVNGIATAQTDINGKVTIPNLMPTDTITFTFQGYAPQTFVANQLPAKVTLNQTSIVINEVVIPGTKPTTASAKKSNWWKWLLAAGGTIAVYKVATNEKKPKTTKNAKI